MKGRSMRCVFFCWVLFPSLFPSAGFVLADVNGTDEVQAAESDFDSWIADWNSSSFSTRNVASQQLRDAGRAAFPALARAAGSYRGEVSARALALLKAALKSTSPEQQAAARQTLDQLAANPDTPAARAARQALQELDRPASGKRTAPFAPRVGIPGPNPGLNNRQQAILPMLQALDRQIAMLQAQVAKQQNPVLAESLNRNLRRVIESRDRLRREWFQIR